MFDKYLYALGRGVRGAKKALDDVHREADPAARARDITPAGEAAERAPMPVGDGRASTPRPRREPVFGARPLVMGVVNTTPDSFSDGGDFLDPAAAIAHGLRLLGEGADILDVGGESSRPGHVVVGADEEIARVLPALRGLAAASDAPLSIDTTKPAVAEAALDAGATVVNDIWGLRREPRLARLAAERGAHVVVMHNRDEIDASIDIVADVIDTLRRSIDIALAAGVAEGRIIVDPGVGFGKTPGQNLLVTRELARLRVLGRPVLLGVSRKRMIGAATGRGETRDRLAGSLAAAVMGAERGAAIVRVHDVAAHVDAMRMYAAIRGAGEAT